MNDENELLILASNYVWYGVTFLVLWSVFAQLTHNTLDVQGFRLCNETVVDR
jgi:hypothetical protein